MFIDTPLFQWVLLPLFIFCARVIDVSVGTIRIILLLKGKRMIVSILAFWEMMLWLLAIRQIFLNLSNPLCIVAFAGGFAVGNYVGMIIEEKLAIGIAIIRIITRKDATELINHLKTSGHGITTLDAKGITGAVSIIFTIVNRSEIKKVIETIQQFNPKAFYSVEDVRSVSEEAFVPRNKRLFPLKKT